MIEARALSKYYGTHAAVQGVDLTLKEGEIVGLAGESGSGKTTLGKMLVRLIDPSSGTLHLDGRELTRAGTKDLLPFRRRVQIIFQDPYGSLNPRQTVASMLREATRFHGLDTPAAELLAQVGLAPELLGKYPHELSGGQRQRVGIARALSVQPRLLIADEPVSALDVTVRAQILELLLELRSRLQLGILFISHDLRAIEYLADRVEIMCEGRIVESLPSAKLEDARHDYTQRLLAALPRLW